MQYLGPIYNKLYLFGRKTLIQLKGFIYYGNTHQNKVLQGINSHTGFFSKDCKILKSFDKTAFENWIFISKSLSHLSSIAGSNFLLSHTLMIPDGYILVILKYLLTVLKP